MPLVKSLCCAEALYRTPRGSFQVESNEQIDPFRWSCEGKSMGMLCTVVESAGRNLKRLQDVRVLEKRGRRQTTQRPDKYSVHIGSSYCTKV